MQCGNNLKQLSLAVHNFHDTHDRLPSFQDDPLFATKRFWRASWLYTLLPFIEQTPLFDGIMATGANGVSDGQWEFGSRIGSLRSTWISTFICPSDNNSSVWIFDGSNSEASATKTNYRGSMADMVVRADADNRSSSPRSWLRNGPLTPVAPAPGNTAGANSGFNRVSRHAGLIGIETITDGTSNTVLITEGVIYDGATHDTWAVDFRANLLQAALFYNAIPNECLRLKGTGRRSLTQAQAQAMGISNARSHGNNADVRMGWRAYDTRWNWGVAVFTLLPPNSPSCRNSSWGGASASSEHSGGVQAALADGSVRFISDTIHTKNLGIAARGSGGAHVPQGESHDNWVPATPIANTTGGTDAVAGSSFSYGVWAELGAINDGSATSF